MASLQSRIDAQSYPPTHCYTLDGMAPRGPLAERLSKMLDLCPGFFEVDRFLEIGANKGFFMAYAAQKSKEVVAIEPDGTCFDLCRDIISDLKLENAHALRKSFASFDPDGQFDSILLANGPHYPFVEYSGWRFLDKLARISGGRVILEGPTGMECGDMRQCIPPGLQEEFKRYRLDAEMRVRGFRKVERVPSPAYTPDRYITLYKRMDQLVMEDMAGYKKYLMRVYRKVAEYTRPTDVVLEVGTRVEDRGILTRGIVPYKQFLMVDKEKTRPGLHLDVLEDDFPTADVILSTCVFHHTDPEDLERLMSRLCRRAKRLLIVEGPNIEEWEVLYGDHKYHLKEAELTRLAASCGFSVLHSERMGITKPYCQLFMVFKRDT